MKYRIKVWNGKELIGSYHISQNCEINFTKDEAIKIAKDLFHKNLIDYAEVECVDVGVIWDTKNAPVTCPKCNHTWDATNFDTDITFYEGESTMEIICPKCKNRW